MGDHLVARPEQHQRGVVQRLFPAGGDDDLRFLVVDAVVGAVAVTDRALQFDDTGRRRVAGEIVIERVVGRGLHRSGRGKIRLPRPEINDFYAFAAQPIDGGGDLHRRRARDAGSAVGQLGHTSLVTITFARSRCSTRSGTSPWTRPPSAKTSLINRELMYVYCSAGIMNTVSIRGVSRRFISAI